MVFQTIAVWDSPWWGVGTLWPLGVKIELMPSPTGWMTRSLHLRAVLEKYWACDMRKTGWCRWQYWVLPIRTPDPYPDAIPLADGYIDSIDPVNAVSVKSICTGLCHDDNRISERQVTVRAWRSSNMSFYFLYIYIYIYIIEQISDIITVV